MYQKTISVVIPVYNVASLLKRCIDSVINQSVSFNEVILVDDGSTDSSPIICDEMAKQYKSIVVVHKKNGGLSDARNTGLNISKSNYVLFVDSDDTIDSNTCEQFQRVLIDSTADIIVANLREVRGSTIKSVYYSMSYGNSSEITGRDFLVNELKKSTMHMASVRSLYKREYLINNGLFFTPGLLHEDELFTPIVFLKSRHVHPTDIEFYNHIIRDGSITTAVDKTRNAESIIRIIDLLYEHLEFGNYDREVKRVLMDHCVDIYYKVFLDASLINHKELRIDKRKLLQYSSSVKNMFRSIVYLISIKAFVFIESTRRNL